MLSLRPMTVADLPVIESWLRLPHVARWWTPDTTAQAQVAEYRERVRDGVDPATPAALATMSRSCRWGSNYVP